MKILLIALTMLVAKTSSAQDDHDIPVPGSITIDESLSKIEAAQLLHTAQMFYAFWNTGKEKYLNQAVSQDFLDRTLPAGRPQGYKGILFASDHFRAAVPDLQCSVEDILITKDKITCRQTYTGHNTGPVNDLPPSGNTVTFLAIDILHVKNGKIYEDWHLEDNLAFLQQAGIVKQLENKGTPLVASPKDTVRHLRIDTLEQKLISSLITRRMASGGNATFGYFEMKKGGVVPLHHHSNEQYTFILRGSVRVTIDGKVYIVQSGQAILIPSNVPHLFECLEDGTIDLDFFAPRREDWINGTDKYFQSN